MYVLGDISFLISFLGEIPQVGNSFITTHSVKEVAFFAVVPICEKDLALATYYMTREAGCSLPPTELSACSKSYAV